MGKNSKKLVSFDELRQMSGLDEIKEEKPQQTYTNARPAREPNAALDTEYYLPIDTARFLFASSGVKVENSALSIEKYIHVPKADRNGDKKFKIDHARNMSPKEKVLLKELNKAQINALGFGGYQAVGVLGDRMTIGLGLASVFETGIILHKPYGFPYIPGSSIKGAFRGFLNKEYSGKFDTDKLFGTQESRGALCFFDAYPTDKLCVIDVDIMNPHFGGWYMNGTPPTDTENPIPVKFYAVPKGAEFTFRIGGAVDEPLKVAFEEMLKFAGLGAKTSVGYGWFQKIG